MLRHSAAALGPATYFLVTLIWPSLKQKRSGVRRKRRRGNMTFQSLWEGCEQMRVDLLRLT